MNDALDALYCEIEKATAAPRGNMVQNRRRLAALKIRAAALRQSTGYKVKKSGDDAEIDKARGGPRSGMIPYGSRHQYGRAKFFEARAKRNGEKLTPRQTRAMGYLAGRFRGSVKGPRGSTRRAFYKSSEPVMSDAIDNLYSEIEKAKSDLGTRKEYGRVASRFKGYVEARQSKNYR